MTAEQRAELRALADRVEASSEPNRNLDALVAASLGFRVVREGHPLGRCCYNESGLLVPIEHYTRLFDAAMKVVPEGKESGALHAAWAAVSVAHALHVRFWKAELDGSYTQALARAVLVAGLRARADEGEGQ